MKDEKDEEGSKGGGCYVLGTFDDIFIAMVALKVTPEVALKFTKLGVAPLGSWPLGNDATRTELVLREIRWWISFLIIQLFLFALIYGIRKHYQDSVIVMQSICFYMGASQIWFKMIIFKTQSFRLQVNLISLFLCHLDVPLREIEIKKGIKKEIKKK